MSFEFTLLDFAYDHEYFIKTHENLCGNNEDICSNWANSRDYFVNNASKDCEAPNEIFAQYSDVLLYEEVNGEKECKLGKWLKSPNAYGVNKLFFGKYYQLGNEELEKEKNKIFRGNIFQIAIIAPDALEKEFNKEIIRQNGIDKIILQAFKETPDYKLKETTLSYLKGEINSKYKSGYCKNETCDLEVGLLISQVLSHKSAEFQYLIEVVKKENIDVTVKQEITKKISESNYYLSKEEIGFIEDLLEDKSVSKYIGKSISKSLANILSTQAEKEVLYVENKVNKLVNSNVNLDNELIDSIFHYYSKDQRYFGNIVVDILAEHKSISNESLEKVSSVIEKVTDFNKQLFIVKRLIQNGIGLPSYKLFTDWIPHINSSDKGVRLQVLDIYEAANQESIKDVISLLYEAVTELAIKAENYELDKIQSIVAKLDSETVNLNSKELYAREEILKVAYKYNEYSKGTLNNKKEIARQLLDRVNSNTANVLERFYKEVILTQERALLELARLGLEKIEVYKNILLTPEENRILDYVTRYTSMEIRQCLSGGDNKGPLPFFKYNTNDQCSSLDNQYNFFDSAVIFEIITADGKFLMSKEECFYYERELSVIDGIKERINSISFESIVGINSFIDFLNKYYSFFEEKGINYIIDTLSINGSIVNLNNIYQELVNNLIYEVTSNIPLIHNIDNFDIQLINQVAYTRSISQLNKSWSNDRIFEYIYRFYQGINNGLNEQSVAKYINIFSYLEKISDYSLLPAHSSRYGDTIEDILETILESVNKSLDQFSAVDVGKKAEDKINQLVRDNNYYKAFTLDQLIKELKLVNNKNEKIKQLIEDQYFESKFKEISTIKENGVLIREDGLDKLVQLKDLKEEEIKNWNQNIKVSEATIAEIIAVISEVAHRTILESKYYPRDIQIISLLSLLQLGHGGLAEIATGEGKSLIIAMFATIKTKEGRQVDIVTSNNVLAERDVREYKEFYNSFNISVAHNIKGRKEYKEECYLADIVYGDLLNFIGDTLRDISRNAKYGRGHDIVVIDEVDNMFIDQNNMKVQLSSPIPGFENLVPVLLYMWGTGIVDASMLKHEGDKCWIKVPKIDEDLKLEDIDLSKTPDIEYELIYVDDSCNKILRGEIYNYTKEEILAYKIDRDARLYTVPEHLEKFAETQLTTWIDSFENAYWHKDKLHYIIYDPQEDIHSIDKFKIVAPVDYVNTGSIQQKLQWSDGLHQFIQLKHGLTVKSEHVVNVYMSYVGFFKKYEGSIYGVTGTLGENSHQKFLKETYRVELSHIPKFIHKDLTEYRPIITYDGIRTDKNDIKNANEIWKQEIIGVIFRKVLDKRAALIIVETIEKVEELEEALLASGYSKKHIITYKIGDQTEEDKIEKNELGIGDVIIATNLAGRGTDLKIDREVINNGGLHLIMGIFSQSIRVEDQAYGRTARKGEPGSAQLIINGNNLDHYSCYENYGCNDIHNLYKERNIREFKKLESNRLCELPYLEIRDIVFEEFVELVKEANSPTGYNLVVTSNDNLNKYENAEALAKQTIYLYKEDNDIYIKISEIDKKKNKVIKVTEKLEVIDKRGYQHTNTLLNKVELVGESKGLRIGLSNQDYELIHFIATTEGYTYFNEIKDRIEYRFNKALENELPNDIVKKEEGWGILSINKKEAYLKWLLLNGEEYSDLKSQVSLDEQNQIDEKKSVNLHNILKQVELRKKYELWKEDRELYNNQSEINQIKEYFGIWLKKHEKALEIDCKIDTDEDKKQLEKLFEEKKAKLIELFFNEIKKDVIEKVNNNNLITNPAYLVLKAWRYLYIDAKDKDYRYQPIKIDKEAESLWNSLITSPVNKVKNLIYGVFEDIGRLGFGSINYRVENPLAQSIKFLEDAIKLNDMYSWAGHNALSAIRLVKDGRGITNVKQGKEAGEVINRYAEDLSNATSKIEEYEIPKYESQLTFLLTHKLVGLEDDLTIQLIGSIEIYKKILEVMYRNFKVLENLSGKEMIRVGNHITLEEITNDIDIRNATIEFLNKTGNANQLESYLNATTYYKVDEPEIDKSTVTNSTAAFFNITQNIGDIGSYKSEMDAGMKSLKGVAKEINFASKSYLLDQITASGGFLYQIETYELEENKSWFTTIFSAVLGVVLIYTGMWMVGSTGPALGVFGKALGVSLIFQGIGDIIGSIISVATNTPMDFEDYIKGKGIAMGISIATAGTLHFLSGIESLKKIVDIVDYIDELAEKLQKASAVYKAFAVQAGLTAGSAVIYNQMKKFVDKEDIESDAKAEITDILNQYKDKLDKIYASDNINGNKELYNQLIRDIEKAVRNYALRFKGEKTSVVKGVSTETINVAASSVPYLGRVISTGVELTMGAIKSVQAIEKMGNKIRKSIDEIVSRSMSSAEMMKKRLVYNFNAIGEQLFEVINAQNYVVAGEIDYRNCNEFNKVNLEEKLKDYHKGLVTTCNHIANIILHNEEKNSMQNKNIEAIFTASVTNLAEGIQKEAIKPIANELATIPNEYVGEYLGEKIRLATEKYDNQPNKNPANPQVDTVGVVQDSGVINSKKDTNNRRKQYEKEGEKNEDTPKDKSYIVVPGDNLNKIIKNLNLDITPADLAKENNIKDPNKIQPGQKIKIPEKRVKTNCEPNCQSGPNQDYTPKNQGLKNSPKSEGKNTKNYLSEEDKRNTNMAEFVYTDLLRKGIKNLSTEQQVHDINEKMKKNDKYKNIRDAGFEATYVLRDKETGFDGILMYSKELKQYTIVISGIDGIHDIKDVKAGLGAAHPELTKQFVRQFQYADKLYSYAKDQLKPGESINAVGHSLGGAHVQVLSAKHDIYATSLDAPGAKKAADMMLGKDKYKTDKITAYTALDNQVNTLGIHMAEQTLLIKEGFSDHRDNHEHKSKYYTDPNANYRTVKLDSTSGKSKMQQLKIKEPDLYSSIHNSWLSYQTTINTQLNIQRKIDSNWSPKSYRGMPNQYSHLNSNNKEEQDEATIN
ncbi:LysM peptidoglycan-binding domain-containing protein [Candidatus Bandiella numerosa]|uniref:LysM peptidoglycan-binding domain-containing protein n=1 Tax=Candidatus Bandiella numerosa TaxID=2570586 RepID=UPI001F349569|nr:LysM peptidoglycan-binding domain-containing protein [Candidatus Bandiella numerosa]